MSRRRSRAAPVPVRSARARPGSWAPLPAEARGLEDLVRMVSALDGECAPALLSGLAETLRPHALGLLACIERSSRADRHAALASAFLPRPTGREPVDALPGQLGVEVRKQLAPAADPTGAPGSGTMVCWARRVALELRALPDSHVAVSRAAQSPARAH